MVIVIAFCLNCTLTGSNRAKHDDTITVSTAYDDVDEDDEEDDDASPEKVNVRRTTKEFHLQHCHEVFISYLFHSTL